MDIAFLNNQDQVQDENTTFSKEIKAIIKHNLKNHYLSAEIPQLLDKCTFVDLWLKHSFTLDYDTVKEILTEIENLPLQSIQHLLHHNQSLLQPSKETSQLFGSVLGISTSNSTGLPDRAKREIDMYLQYPSLHTDMCPLKIWKQESSRIPLLSILARKYLCICAFVHLVLHQNECSIMVAILLQKKEAVSNLNVLNSWCSFLKTWYRT